MNNPKMNYFPDQDIIHIVITNEEEFESLELSPNITAELNANGNFIGVEILKASTFFYGIPFWKPCKLNCCNFNMTVMLLRLVC
jgi:uncharacterized protein YuzE